MDDGKRGPDGKRRDRKPDNNQWKASTKTLLVWAAIVTLALIIMNFMEEGGSVKEFSSINEFNKYLEVIKKIEITNVGTSADISGEFKEPVNFSVNGSSKKFSKFILTYPFVEIEKASEWEEKGIEVKFTKEGIGFSSFLISMIPWILIIALWIYLLRRMQGGNQNGGKGIFNFGKSRARLITEANNPIKFTDVAGAKEAKEELQEVISFLKSPGRYIEIGAKIPKGILLLGSPGTGKTLLAKAVAGEAGVPFFSMSGADFVEMFVGVGASRVRDLFEQARRQTPCIIFIDELDAVGRHRGTGIGGGNDEREQTLNQLLVEMDGFETRETIILIAATNRPDVLDPALLRPGRFDRQIVVDRPDVKARKEILEVHAKKIKVNKNGIDFEVVAKSTPGMSGADLANIVNEAALLAARQGRKLVEMIDIEEAKDKVMMGVERKSAVINEREKELTAYHEAGHVLVAKFTEDSDPVHKVTIIPRGRAMGVTHYIPIEDRHSYSKKYIMSKLLHLLGGRVAEELVFNDVTTGASNDIERATDLARKMVCEWGMSDEVGPIHYGVKNEDPFLGKQLTRTSSVSEKIGNTIDLAIQKIIFDALEQTRKILNDNIDLLHKLSKELLEKETLTGEEINNILSPKVDEAIEIETESESVMA
ncbi:MAG: ATP-dependent zinc metalloprotease FtsH [Candidatus Delongbacteria bacterium]|nr:ATP-dependent zinc metalloprotease FtsH [Candidatus Delongbacteria bacterium]MBN2835877.1 ATP-dependent zinc metalloprotease FtsH [Candidatus Delongbacteria bacterium]